MFISDLLFNRYTLGISAVGYFAYGPIIFGVEILNQVAETLATIPGLN